MTDNRRLILSWAEQGLVKGDVDQALAVTGSRPQKSDWFSFISQFLLWGGAVAVSVGVIFFFAFNWDVMGRFIKFAVLEGVIVLAMLIYSRLDNRHLSSKVTLLAISLLTGALLALTGQTYQTGADPWELFAVWALLISPWAVMARSSVLWLLWVGLINLALMMYLTTFRGLLGLFFREENWLWIFLIANSAFLIVFEILACLGQQSSRIPTLPNRQVAQVAALIAGFTVSWLAIVATFDSHNNFWGLAVYVIWMFVAFYVYRYRVLDLLLLSSCVLSVILVTTFVLGRLFENMLDEGAFLLISMVIIGLSAAGGIWLKKLAQQQKTFQSLKASDPGEVS